MQTLFLKRTVKNNFYKNLEKSFVVRYNRYILKYERGNLWQKTLHTTFTVL